MPRNSVFISYSHQDKKWLIEIKKALSILEYNHDLIIWDDTKIRIGNNWHSDIVQSINESKIAILLVSSNFLSSEFIVKNELPPILKAATKKGLIIFNIIIDVCTFQLTELKTFQCLNNPAFPLEDLERRERKEVFVKLAVKLLEVIKIQSGDEKPNLMEDYPALNVPLVLGCLVHNGAKSITEAQKVTGLRRKCLVDTLDELFQLRYLEKEQIIINKKPSTQWKASSLGINIFRQFQSFYDKIIQSK